MNALTMNEMKTVGGGCDIRRFRTYSRPAPRRPAPARKEVKTSTYHMAF